MEQLSPVLLVEDREWILKHEAETSAEVIRLEMSMAAETMLGDA